MGKPKRNPATDPAIAAQRQALAMALSTGDVAGAARLMPKLLKHQGDDPALHHTAAEIAWRQGDRTNALKHFGGALGAAIAGQAQGPAEQTAEIAQSAAQHLGHLLGSYAIDCKGLLTRPVLVHLLNRTDVDPQAVASAAAPIWMDTPPWRRAFQLSANDAADWLLGPDGAAARADTLAAALLTRAVLSNPKIEALLLTLREKLVAQDKVDEDYLRLIAQQWYLRDYAGVVSDTELSEAGHLKRALYSDPASWLTEPDGVDPWCDRIAEQAIEEAKLAAVLPNLEQDAAETATVRDQYEQHPYPRWIGLTVPAPGSRRALAWRADPDAGNPARKLFWQQSPFEALIAGCGTGRHALMAALGYGPLAKVLAVDISAASLAYASRKAGEYQANNLTFARADLLRLGDLPDELLPKDGFDLIESVGVLHHLADTGEGLRSLAQHLKPGGLIQLGLYRKDGRKHVALARADIKQLGLDATKDEDIRIFRAHILNQPDHPAFSALAHNRDFYSLPGCRDLLFHARERDIEMTEIGPLLTSAGLNFAGMQMPDGVLQAFAQAQGAQALTDLNAWQGFEADRPDLFDAMYRFWAVKPK
ncbi:MAG: class I SAM-dependent methyltransferase [Alphaproteobacteria bacterium]|nr:class I SAM-dependent methyltransferase [Alphaproteobacteria bacterium SS10]